MAIDKKKVRNKSRNNTDEMNISSNNFAKTKCKNCSILEKTIKKMTALRDGLPPKQRYFDEEWLSLRWGVSKTFLQKIRYQGIKQPEGRKEDISLPYTKFGGSVRYRLRDIVKFERDNKVSAVAISTKSRMIW